MNPENSKELHRAAMRYSQEAYMAIENGDKEQAFSLYEQAFLLEKQAAHHLDRKSTRLNSSHG